MENNYSGYQVLYLQANFCTVALLQLFRVLVKCSIFICFVVSLSERAWAPNNLNSAPNLDNVAV